MVTSDVVTSIGLILGYQLPRDAVDLGSKDAPGVIPASSLCGP